jgi:hypothetical protein
MKTAAVEYLLQLMVRSKNPIKVIESLHNTLGSWTMMRFDQPAIYAQLHQV